MAQAAPERGDNGGGGARAFGLATGSATSTTTTGDESTFKILITTDNHLGFMERDPKRGDDSFTTFEEILRAARVEHAVDFMLLGGDLFHDNKPSLGCLNRTCTLFRKYLWGNKPVRFHLRSKPEENFPTHGLPLANWQEPNMNISVPVFAIHGNHDDPVGGTSSLDILANNGHLNYFGIVSSLEDVVVQPVLLQKANTRIALYGLGNIRDDRLHRCFQLKKVHFVAPKQQEGVCWFRILILHQNRGMRDTRSKSGITEAMLAGFGMHLVIWGNEHEQRMVPEPTPHRFDVIQPGSSILTSITPLECNPKQYGILEIRGMSYRMTPFPLRSVRPVVRRTVQLCRDNPRGRTLDEVEDYLRTVVEEMVDEAERQLQDIPDDVLQFHPSIRFPLMRLSVDFSDPDSTAFPKPNFIRFGQQYMDIVANPGDMVKEIAATDRRSAASRAALLRGGTVMGLNGRKGGNGPDGAGGEDAFNFAAVIPQFRSVDIATKVAEVFRSGIRPPCQILSEMELSAAVYAFAEKNERSAIEDKIEEMLHTAQKMIWKRLGESEDILDPDVVAAEMRRCKVERERKFFKELEEAVAGSSDACNEDGVVDSEEERDGDEHRGIEKTKPNARGVGGRRNAADGDAADSDADDPKGEATRLMRLSQMFDGLPPGTGDRAGVGSSSSPAGAEGLLRAKPHEMPPFLRDHMRVFFEQQRQQEGDRAGHATTTDGGRAERSHAVGDPHTIGGDGIDDQSYESLLHAELEDLPADGLHHVTLDEFIARQVGDGPDATSGKKRSRTANGAGCVLLNDLETDDMGGDVEVLDGGDNDGSRAHHADGRSRAAATTLHGADGAATLPTHIGQPTATRRRGERQPKGRAGAASSSTRPQPVTAKLDLYTGGSAAAAAAPPAGRPASRASAATSARTSTAKGGGTATLQLLSKWGSQPNGK